MSSTGRFIEPQEDHSRRINLVPEPTEEYLNPRQYKNYLSHRREFVQWMLHFGKDPDEPEGYAYATVHNRAKNHDSFCRWAWQNRTDGYTLQLTHDHADDYLDYLHIEDYSEDHKANVQKALSSLFEWRDDTDEWDPRRNFTGSSGRSSPHDYLKREERDRLQEAALEFGTVPHYNSLTPEERAEWKHLLAERFRKPKSEVGPEDFERANGFKIPSIIYTSLDAGFRPIEVGRAKAQWVDLQNGVLNIPKDESTKNRENWVIALRSETVEMLDLWLDERSCYPKYDGSPYLWLTRDGHQYSTRTCNYLFEQLCDLAGINLEERDLSWYGIRHSTGTYLSDESGLKSTADQLRHKSLDTTKRYDHSPPEQRRDGLESI